MKRSCKHIDITDWKAVLPWVRECVNRHKTRYDFQKMICKVGGLTKAERDLAISGNAKLLDKACENIAREAAQRIKVRSLNLPPCHIREKQDHSTLKLRMIGKESAMQQVLDYIAVNSCNDIWKRRIVPQQSSSIKGRGQAYGAVMISKWFKADKRAADYAHGHNLKYTRKCKYYVKLDVKKCYQSLRVEKFMNLFRRDCGNEDILWLWEQLLKSHRVELPDGTINEGFMIGALPSQMAAQYMLSFLYRYATNLHSTRRGKQKQMVSHAELFMDDILLTGSSYKDLKKATGLIIRYAQDELGLTIKPDWQICHTDASPVDMMGFVIHADGNVTVRPRVFIKARRMMLRTIRHGISLRQARRISSYKGFFWQKKKKHRKMPLKSWTADRKYHLWKIFKESARVVSRDERRKNENRIQRRTGDAGLYAVA